MFKVKNFDLERWTSGDLIRLFKQMKDCIVENQQLIGVDLFCSKYSPADKDEA